MTEFTDAVAAKDPPKVEKGNQRIVYDVGDGKKSVRGLGLRITKAGTRSYIFNYRTRDGIERRYTVARHGERSLFAARERAKELRIIVDAGGDPVEEDRMQRLAETISDLARDFKADHLPKKRPATARDYEHLIDTYILKEVGSKRVAEVTYADVAQMHRKITRTGKGTTANRVVAVLSRMFTEAIKLGIVTVNPTKSIERNEETKRERFLNADELERLLDALAKLEDQEAANIFRLILLTGARKSEVLGATWSMFDLANGVWTKPSHHTKTNKTHTIPLSAPARLLLVEIQEAQAARPSDYVFPVRRVSTKADTVENRAYRQNVKNAWAAVLKLAKIDDFRMHDMRHSYASFLVAEGMSLPLIGRLLGHTQSATTDRYAHLEISPLRKATDRVGDIVSLRSVAK